MIINHEFWQAVAAGLLGALVAKGVAITNRDSRRLLHDGQDMLNWLRVEGWGAIGYVPTGETVGLLWEEAQADFIRSPRIRGQAIPLVVGASADKGTLTAEEPGVGFQTYVFAWDFTEFSEVGDLATHLRPGPGVYVLANRDEPEGGFGLPSSFLTLTE